MRQIARLMVKNKASITPTMADVISRAIKNGADNLRVCLPAKVIKYDHKKQSADVQLVLYSKDYEDNLVDMPILYGLPVIYQRTQDSFLHMPLSKDDYCTLFFSDRSLDVWLSNGGSVDPKDVRSHDLSDAIVYPGLYPFSDSFSPTNSKDVSLKCGNTTMFARKNGHFSVQNQNNELIRVLDDLVRILREAVVYTSGGPQHLRHHLFDIIQDRLRTFLEA